MACCITCENINNNPQNGVRGGLAAPVKLHACDIELLTGGGGGGALSNVTSTDLVHNLVPDGATATIPAGFIHGSISVLTGQATINGALYNAGESLSLDPMFPSLRYGAYPITGITGSIRINYHTLP